MQSSGRDALLPLAFCHANRERPPDTGLGGRRDTLHPDACPVRTRRWVRRPKRHEPDPSVGDVATRLRGHVGADGCADFSGTGPSAREDAGAPPRRFAMVKAATEFVSPNLNEHDLSANAAVVSVHPQPHYAQRTVDKLKEIPRRSGPGQEGFDALGIVLVDMRNDGSPVQAAGATPRGQVPLRADAQSRRARLRGRVRARLALAPRPHRLVRRYAVTGRMRTRLAIASATSWGRH